MAHSILRNRLLGFAFLILTLNECSFTSGQIEPGIGFAKPTVQRWTMGVEVSATGETRGISTLFPIPVDWPEQKVKILTQEKTRNVTRVSTRFVDSSKTCKIAIVTIGKMSASEVARATITFEITKSHITEPDSKAPFQFDKGASRKMRSYLIPSPYIESTDRRIEEIAAQLPKAENDWDQVRVIFDWVRENVEYEFDEKIKSSLVALDQRKGDCEELSSLFIAICRAKGIPARAVWIPGHTYPEFYLVDAKGKGHWFPCQVAGGNNDFGRMPEDKPILQKGDRFKIPGHSKMQRYARPTLTARNAASSPRLKWIMEPDEKASDESSAAR